MYRAFLRYSILFSVHRRLVREISFLPVPSVHFPIVSGRFQRTGQCVHSRFSAVSLPPSAACHPNVFQSILSEPLVGVPSCRTFGVAVLRSSSYSYAARLAVVAYSDSVFGSFPCGVPVCCGLVLHGFLAFVGARLFAIVLLGHGYFLLPVIVQSRLLLMRQ